MISSRFSFMEDQQIQKNHLVEIHKRSEKGKNTNGTVDLASMACILVLHNRKRNEAEEPKTEKVLSRNQ